MNGRLRVERAVTDHGYLPRTWLVLDADSGALVAISDRWAHAFDIAVRLAAIRA